jgi:uncharacterized protein with FMN-binding domain
MRRSTAAALGTLTGAALIVGVRLSVTAPTVTAAPPAIDLSGSDAGADSATPATKAPAKNKEKAPATSKTTAPPNTGGEAGADESGGLKNGIYKGSAADYAYGTIQVSIRVAGGKLAAADATYPVASESATINPPAIANLKKQTLKAKTANDLNTVSGATLTSEAYKKSLQAALDAAGA